MRASFGDASALIIASNRLTKGAFVQLPAAFCTEQIFFRRSAAELLILAEDSYHLPTKRDDLNFPVFVVASKNLMLIQIYIAILDRADGRSSAAGVQQEIDDNPGSIYREAARRGGTLQKKSQLLIRIGLLNCFCSLILRHFNVAIFLLLAPIKESCHDASIALNRTGSEPRLAHGYDHFV